MTHELKTLPEFFAPLLDGRKRFEIRRNDRRFSVGDELHLREWDGFAYTGMSVRARVVYLTDYAQRRGYVVLGLAGDTP